MGIASRGEACGFSILRIFSESRRLPERIGARTRVGDSEVRENSTTERGSTARVSKLSPQEERKLSAKPRGAENEKEEHRSPTSHLLVSSRPRQGFLWRRRCRSDVTPTCLASLNFQELSIARARRDRLTYTLHTQHTTRMSRRRGR